MNLKPCPFCGGKAFPGHKISFVAHGERVDDYYVSCVDCGAKGPAYYAEEDIFRRGKITEQKAINAWNRRTDDAKE